MQGALSAWGHLYEQQKIKEESPAGRQVVSRRPAGGEGVSAEMASFSLSVSKSSIIGRGEKKKESQQWRESSQISFALRYVSPPSQGGPKDPGFPQQ